MTNNFQFLTFEVKAKVAHVTLNRPEVHNALHPGMLEELHAAFESIAASSRDDLRAVVMRGAGKSFCAGADVNWMRESLAYTEEENVADALRMGRTFRAIDTCPVPVIACVHGAALGGGVGLAAVSDIVVAEEGAAWGLSEVKLGIAPAVISPYVLRKIGRGHARALFLTGERFATERAVQIGLAHHIVKADELEQTVAHLTAEILNSSPHGIERAKHLIAVVPDLEPDEAMQFTAETIAALRVSEQGQEGLRAFLEKRKPGWAG